MPDMDRSMNLACSAARAAPVLASELLPSRGLIPASSWSAEVPSLAATETSW